MPRGPKGEKRPADVIGSVAHAAKGSTGPQPRRLLLRDHQLDEAALSEQISRGPRRHPAFPPVSGPGWRDIKAGA
jgi:hypothetical protein